MVVIGLILIVIAVAATAGVVLDSAQIPGMQAFGVSLSNISTAGLFLAGLVTGVLFLLGVALIKAASARARAKRRKVKSLRQSHERSVADLEAENTRLAREREQLQSRLESSRPEPATTEQRMVRPGDDPER